ncbi:5-oxoprolinase [Elysia marginata]|uniref:5-oxoprolinase n=1 Tax=Elysia marginata TaxID=1093978 RepID=A0AAV4FAY3_9GAST|nr:5-oxoprolinase [Elysia marginata]
MDAACSGKFQFAIDRGGTFTDVWARCPNGKVRVMKLLSEDPANYPDAPKEAIRRIIQQETKSDGIWIDTSQIDWIRMGTTVATNALLERKGEPMALVITKGFRDLLHIGNQSRPNIFDLEIVSPEHLYEDVVEVEERLVLHQPSCQLSVNAEVVVGTTGEKVSGVLTFVFYLTFNLITNAEMAVGTTVDMVSGVVTFVPDLTW